MFPSAVVKQARAILKACEQKGVLLATAESCTGGLIAALLTEIPGSSAVFERGFVTYSNSAKIENLGVSAALIKRYGAVSAQVARAMGKGALAHSNAHIALSVTGIAGPGGGTKAKPVGLVYVALAHKKRMDVQECRFKGTRTQIRIQALTKALSMLTEHLSHYS